MPSAKVSLHCIGVGIQAKTLVTKEAFDVLYAHAAYRPHAKSKTLEGKPVRVRFH